MNLWWLEVHRMVRTHRWTALIGVYLCCGILGPVTGRYLGEILSGAAGNVVIEVPDPRPVDGVTQFISNTTQLGLLAVVIVAASALAIDARMEVSAFLRTRVQSAHALLWPRYVVVASTAVLALAIGTAVAWVLTGVLLGGPPVGAMLVGTIFGAIYVVFAVAVLAVVGAWMRGMLPTAFAGLGVLIALPLVGAVPAIEPWLPSHLVTAVVAMIDGAPATDYLRAAVISTVLVPVLLGVAAIRLDRREV